MPDVLFLASRDFSLYNFTWGTYAKCKQQRKQNQGELGALGEVMLIGILASTLYSFFGDNKAAIAYDKIYADQKRPAYPSCFAYNGIDPVKR